MYSFFQKAFSRTRGCIFSRRDDDEETSIKVDSLPVGQKKERNVLDKKIAGSGGLKPLTGPYRVSFIDVEWEARREESLADVRLLGDDFPFVLGRIYYPSELIDDDSTSDEYERKRATWLPSSHYFPGYGYFLRIPPLVSSGIGRLLVSNFKMWATENDQLYTDKIGKELTEFPLAIFSHGIAGIRTTYSTICCEMASRGFIVVALEHRDGSASMTINQEGKVFPYKPGPSGYSNLPTVDYEYRAAQLRHRVHEIKSTLGFLEGLNKGSDDMKIVSKTSNNLNQFRNRLEMDKIVLIGHSFGAASCLAASQEIDQVKAMIIIDPWMFPLPRPKFKLLRGEIDTLLIINEKFSWPENDEDVQKFVQDFKELGNYERIFGKCTLLGGGHMDQSDIASIVPARIIQLLRPGSSIPRDPHSVLQTNVDIMASHLKASGKLRGFKIHSESDFKGLEDDNSLRFDFLINYD